VVRHVYRNEEDKRCTAFYVAGNKQAATVLCESLGQTEPQEGAWARQ